jgi:hypothetical protein
MKLAWTIAAIAVAGSSCREGGDHARPDAVAPRAVTASSPPPDAGTDAGPAPRCTPTTDVARDLSWGEAAELGEVVFGGDSFVFGAVRSGDAGRVASVLRVGEHGSVAVDLGPAPADAVAPQPVVRGDDVFAVTYLKRRAAPSSGPARRALSVQRVAAAAERILELPPEGDMSSAYDVVAAPSGGAVGAVVAWDDDSGTPAHGVVQVAALNPDLRAVKALRVVRPSTEPGAEATDAGDPRLASRAPAASGYWLSFIARRPEHVVQALPLPAGEIETPSQEAMYGWVEAVALDAEGAPLGAPRRLTSSTGHVASYAVAAEGGALIVVAEDEGPSGHGGGSLDQVVLRGDATPELRHLVRSGVEEETPPSLVRGLSDDLWLTFLDVQGDTELMPAALAPPATSPPTPTHEPLLQGGRLLGASDSRRMALAVAPVTPSTTWTLRWATCTR